MWITSNVGPGVQFRVFREVVDDKDVLGVVCRGAISDGKTREIDSCFAASEVSRDHRMAHLDGVSIGKTLEGERLGRRGGRQGLKHNTQRNHGVGRRLQ